MPNEKSIFNINGTDFPLSDPNAVKFDRQQSLTSQQKAQAIANMGIGDMFKGLLYRGEWLGHSLNYSEGNGFWFVPANTLTASADLPGEYQTTKEAVYAVIDLEPSDLTTSPLKRIEYLAWLESYMSGHVVLKVYRRPEVSISGGGGVTVYEWENASAPVDTMKSIAIIVSGDRASMAVPVGGYAYIKDNTHGLAEGLYTNTSSAAFPTVGGTADSTVFTAASGGGLNGIMRTISFVPPEGNAGFHNSVYRGKYLGNTFTAEQDAAIRAGTFDGLYVGDYWTINGVDWVIVGFDIRLNIGDPALTTHHIGVMPRASLYSTQWHTSNDTSMGYVGSAIRANIKASGGAQEKFIAAFGSANVLSFRELYPSTYSGGNATGWAWVDARTELLSEVDVYGCMAWSLGGKGYEVGADKSQLPIFRLRPDFANIRAIWWLRSVYSAANACYVGNDGNASYGSASGSLEVRPLSLIA